MLWSYTQISQRWEIQKWPEHHSDLKPQQDDSSQSHGRCILRKIISMKPSRSDLNNIYLGNPNDPSSLGDWKKKCSSFLRKQSLSSKYGLCIWRQQWEDSRTDLPASKNKSFCSKEAQVQDCYWIVFLLLSPVLCLSSSSPDSRGNLKDQKETKMWSFSSSVLPRQFWLIYLGQMAISLWSSSWTAWTWSHSPAARYSVQTLSHCTWRHRCCLAELALGDTDPYICRDPDTV